MNRGERGLMRRSGSSDGMVRSKVQIRAVPISNCVRPKLALHIAIEVDVWQVRDPK